MPHHHFSRKTMAPPLRIRDMQTEGKGISNEVTTERAGTIIGMAPTNGFTSQDSNKINPNMVNPKVGGKILNVGSGLLERMRQIAPRVGEKKEKKKKVILEF